jgi:hypothetical protein
MIEEEMTTGNTGSYLSKNAFKKNNTNIYRKLGWKLVNRNLLRKKAKGQVYRDLW